MGDESEGKSDSLERAHDTSLSVEERMEALAEDPPKDPKDWPSDRDMRNATFGGADGGGTDAGYDEGLTSTLGPSEVRHHEDGTVTVHGEEVDDPEEYKGEKIEGEALDLIEHRQSEDSDSEQDSDSDEGSEKSEE